MKMTFYAQIYSEKIENTFYTNLFGTKKPATPLNLDILQSGSKLDAQESLELIKIVTEEEIKNALFDIGNEKAPGPDGYTSTFFKKNWETAGKDLVAAIKEFFATGRLLKRLNATIISLIPKTSNGGRFQIDCLLQCDLQSDHKNHFSKDLTITQ